MRITEDIVKRSAEWATEVTDGAFRLQAIGASLGHGKRYIDGVQQLVWLGRYGSREATAYYLAAAAEWANLSDRRVPEVHAETLAFLGGGGQPRSVRDAGDLGRADAMGRWRARRKG